jgi:hypothetical protein
MRVKVLTIVGLCNSTEPTDLYYPGGGVDRAWLLFVPAEELDGLRRSRGKRNSCLERGPKIRHLNGREPSADDRVLKQKGSLPITKSTQALALFETLIAGGSRRNRDYCAPVPRLADMGSDPRRQSGPRFGGDIHFATDMSRDRLRSWFAADILW